MKYYYIVGTNGYVLQLSDGRYADTVGDKTSEGFDSLLALACLHDQICSEWTAVPTPLFGDMDQEEMENYVFTSEVPEVQAQIEDDASHALSHYRTLYKEAGIEA